MDERPVVLWRRPFVWLLGETDSAQWVLGIVVVIFLTLAGWWAFWWQVDLNTPKAMLVAAKTWPMPEWLSKDFVEVNDRDFVKSYPLPESEFVKLAGDKRVHYLAVTPVYTTTASTPYDIYILAQNPGEDYALLVRETVFPAQSAGGYRGAYYPKRPVVSRSSRTIQADYFFAADEFFYFWVGVLEFVAWIVALVIYFGWFKGKHQKWAKAFKYKQI